VVAARREPTLVLAPAREATRPGKPDPAATPVVSWPAAERSGWRADTARAAADQRATWRAAAARRAAERPAAEPAPARPSAPDRPAPARRPLLRRTRRMVRRLITLCLVLLVLAVAAVVGTATLAGTTPDRVLDRVTVVLEQIRNGGS
jgi:hypothetical protein